MDDNRNNELFSALRNLETSSVEDTQTNSFMSVADLKRNKVEVSKEVDTDNFNKALEMLGNLRAEFEAEENLTMTEELDTIMNLLFDIEPEESEIEGEQELVKVIKGSDIDGKDVNEVYNLLHFLQDNGVLKIIRTEGLEDLLDEWSHIEEDVETSATDYSAFAHAVINSIKSQEGYQSVDDMVLDRAGNEKHITDFMEEYDDIIVDIIDNNYDISEEDKELVRTEVYNILYDI